MGIKRDVLDTLFSNLVRERANWTCEVCHKYFPEGHRQGLDCSHFFSRARKSVRYHPDNAGAMCVSCHFRLGGNPIEFGEWIRKHLGEKKTNALRLRANRVVKFSKADKDEMKKQMRKELKRLQDLRAEGETGRLAFRIPVVGRA